MDLDSLQYIPHILIVIYTILFTSNYLYQVLFNMVFGINSHRYYTIQDYFESSFDFVATPITLTPLIYLASLLAEWLDVFAWRYAIPVAILCLHLFLFVSLHLTENIGTKAGLKTYLRKATLMRPGEAVRILMPAAFFILIKELLLPALHTAWLPFHHIALGVIQYYLFVANMAMFRAGIMKRDLTFRPIFKIRFKEEFADQLPDQSRIRIVNSTSKYLFVHDYRTNTISVVRRDCIDSIEYFLYKDRPPFGG